MTEVAGEEELGALHVIIDNAGEKDVAADWGSWQTFPIAPATPPQQILSQNNKRKEAEIIVLPGAGSASVNNSGTANSPLAAGAVVTSITLPIPGTYTVNWSVSLSGTSSATDGSNLQLLLNGALVIQSSNGSTTITIYPQVQVVITTTTPNAVLSINAGPATPTATCNYRASISAALQTSLGFVRVGTRAQVMNGQGGQLQAGRYPYEAKQEIWCGSDGVTNMNVVVLDERYE